MTAVHNKAIRYRPEVDGLRAIAILPVILFHAGLKAFPGGYVGVDVFFVISGYLITSILRRELEQGNFSITRFYERRARRILPALTLVVLCSLALSWALMLPEEINKVAETVIWLGQFASNLYFAGHINYFSPTAEGNPLLHTWSLAVEEQYYLLFPVLLLVLWRGGRHRTLFVVLALIGVSLALAESLARAHPTDGYYLLQTRAWELLVGSMIALWATDNDKEFVGRMGSLAYAVLPVVGLMLIAYAVFTFDNNTPFPSLYALVPVLGAALVIQFASGSCITSKLLSSKFLVGVGLISYSAYLWHQPLFAFARFRGSEGQQPLVMWSLAGLSMALAFFTWKYVEAPFRDPKKIGRKQIFVYSFAGLALFAVLGNGIPVISIYSAEGSQYASFAKQEGSLSKNTGFFDNGCQDRDGVFLPENCTTAPHAKVLLWGDSFAMHLAQFVRNDELGLVQATKSSCFPNTILTPYSNDRSYNREWAKQCHTFSRSVVEFARASPDIGVVVISSLYSWPLEYEVWDGESFRRPTRGEYFAAVKHDVDSLRAAGKKVVLVSPTPQDATTALRCAKQVLRDTHEGAMPDFGNCRFQGTLGAGVEPFLNELRREANVHVFDLRPFLCSPDNSCSPVVDGTPVYLDFGHITPFGARLMEEKFNIGNRILGAAT